MRHTKHLEKDEDELLFDLQKNFIGAQRQMNTLRNQQFDNINLGTTRDVGTNYWYIGTTTGTANNT